MRFAQTTPGRTFTVVLDHGEDFYKGLAEFCTTQSVKAGRVSFLGGFRFARLVATCGPLEKPDEPLWDDVKVEYLEALGHGTLAWNVEEDRLAPHIHVTAGLKGASAEGRTSHLLEATVQFLQDGRPRYLQDGHHPWRSEPEQR
ncbi:PPC domain-containing DNA-binding protein [Streptomyces sp. NPDC102274]|uniref:PPC domain-containing DNA-binding protein n=1 Tax=Streptomyces sp. NPDC102274 TaxID=3366151 RepID=UPI0038243097